MSATLSRLVALNPADRAGFATTARLVSCLVTESLVRALYFTVEGFGVTGISIIFSGGVSSEPPTKSPYQAKDILAIIPLRHTPVFKHDGTDTRGKEIGLLDPLDMLPLVFGVCEDGIDILYTEHFGLSSAILQTLSGPGWALSRSSKLVLVKSPLPLWEKFGISIGLEEDLLEEIAYELDSSIIWQTYSYQHPPKAPSFASPSIEWEQSIVEGHPTHPMHKMRHFLPPMTDITPGSYDLYSPQLRLVAFPRENLKITYDFEKHTQPVRDAASKNAGQRLVIPDGYVVVPVHELQVAHIREKFQEAKIYPPQFSVPALAQQSIRSVIVPGVYRELSLKLSVGIKLTSSVRTIYPTFAYLGPRFSAHLVPALTMDRNILTVAKELSSVVHAHPNREIAKYCAAIVREAHENISEEKGERLIVCTSLVESGHAGGDDHISPVIRIFSLDTEPKRIQWLDRFVRVFFEAFLPPVIHNGVAFECHPQNCVARFDIVTQELRGFIIRDFGGLRVHLGTLRESTGVDLDFLAGHYMVADDLDDIFTRMYHTVIHNHLQQLIRVLGLHYNGQGWRIVRKHLMEIIPRNHALYNAWLSPEHKTFPGKCFMRMRMQRMYRFMRRPFPNLIHYQGVSVA